MYITTAYTLLYKLNHGNYNQSHFHEYLPNATFFNCKIKHGLLEKYEPSSDTKFQV